MTMTNRSRWIALYVLCLGDIMIVLDGTIVNVALPSIRDDLGFSQESLAWIVNAYLLTFGGFLLLGGRLGDLFGHRRLFLIGIALFTAASLGCGLANSQGLLIAGRAVQGVGGAIVSAVALSLLMLLFTETADRAKAMGVFGFVLSGGGVIGVLAGGILTDLLSWHWIFLVNLPVGVTVFILSLRLLPAEHGPAATGKVDYAGAITVTSALMLAVYAIVNGNEQGWGSAQTLGMLGASAALIGVFLVIESRVASPLVPLGLFRNRNVSTSNVVGVLMAAGMFSYFFFSALYLQLVLEYSPMEVGLAYLPGTIIWGASSLFLSQRLVMRYGIKPPLLAGLGLMTLALVLLARTPVDGNWAIDILPATIALGIGAGIAFNPILLAAMSGVGARAGRARVGRRQHVVHDGRRGGSRDPRQPRRVTERQPARVGRGLARRAEQRLPPRLPGRCSVPRRGRLRRCRAATRRGTAGARKRRGDRRGRLAARAGEIRREPASDLAELVRVRALAELVRQVVHRGLRERPTERRRGAWMCAREEVGVADERRPAGARRDAGGDLRRKEQCGRLARAVLACIAGSAHGLQRHAGLPRPPGRTRVPRLLVVVVELQQHGHDARSCGRGVLPRDERLEPRPELLQRRRRRRVEVPAVHDVRRKLGSAPHDAPRGRDPREPRGEERRRGQPEVAVLAEQVGDVVCRCQREAVGVRRRTRPRTRPSTGSRARGAPCRSRPPRRRRRAPRC